VFSVAVVLPLLAACYGYGGSSSSSSYDAGSGGTAATCDDVFNSALQRESRGDTSGTINSEIDWLGRNCSTQYDTLIGYISTKATIDPGNLESCDVWLERIGLGAAELLWDDRLCTAESTETETEPDAGSGSSGQQPGGGIAWDEAISYVGTSQRVCGPLAGSGNSTDDVFLNLGRDYPDRGRFQIVIWDVGSLEPIAYGSTLCTTGVITNYEGVAQIELNDPGMVEIYG